MGTETAYLCPVCLTELVRFPDNWQVTTAYIAEAVNSAAARHTESVERALLDAIDAHHCPKPLRWRLWRRRHREELTAAAVR